MIGDESVQLTFEEYEKVLNSVEEENADIRIDVSFLCLMPDSFELIEWGRHSMHLVVFLQSMTMRIWERCRSYFMLNRWLLIVFCGRCLWTLSRAPLLNSRPASECLQSFTRCSGFDFTIASSNMPFTTPLAKEKIELALKEGPEALIDYNGFLTDELGTPREEEKY